MASNNNNQPRGVGGPPPLGNPGMASPASANQPPHLRTPPPPGSSPFQGLFHSQAHPQAQPQVHSPFQIQMGSQSQVGLLGSSSPSFSTPGLSGGPKRLPQKPPARPPAPISAAASPIIKAADITAAARRKKRRLPEKQLPDRVGALLPESALYTQLLEFEARVDAALARKKIDIQEALRSPPSMQRTLRIYVFNTFANQTRMNPESMEPPSWSLKIVGRILEDGVDPDPAGGLPKPNPMYPKFSSFFRRVTIALDPSLYPENPTIVWEQARSPVPQEGFEVKRRGDKEFTASIRLEMNYNPEKFRLSPPLMEVLGIEVDTRARIIAGIWQYVKAKKLQSTTDSSYFACDPPLKKIFGEDKMKFAMVSQKISHHLYPPQPIHLEHKIRLSGNGAVGNACYDVLVDVPFPLQKEMAAFLANTEKHRDIEACDEVICASIKKIHEHRRRRAFFLGFSQSPVEFINTLIASQSRDLKLVAGEASRNAERERRSDFYNQPWVEDAVIRYLNRKPAAGSDAPGYPRWGKGSSDRANLTVRTGSHSHSSPSRAEHRETQHNLSPCYEAEIQVPSLHSPTAPHCSLLWREEEQTNADLAARFVGRSRIGSRRDPHLHRRTFQSLSRVTVDDLRAMKVLQSGFKKCVDANGLGLQALVSQDYCQVMIQYPRDTVPKWRDPKTGELEGLSFDFNLCEAVATWEQVRNSSTILTKEFIDALPNGWEEYAWRRINKGVHLDRCKNRTLCMEKLSLVLPETPPFVPWQFERCAVIGNSGDLLKTNFGEEIDDYDAVVRENGVPIQNYTRYVGRKSTFRLLNRGSAKALDKIAELDETKEEVLIIKTTIHDVMNKMIREVPIRNKVYLMLGASFGSSAKGTGLKALEFALSICETVDMYGFTVDPGYKEWTRYFSGSRQGHTPLHGRTYYQMMERIGAGMSDPFGACSIIRKRPKGKSPLISGLRKAALKHQSYVKGASMYPLERNTGNVTYFLSKLIPTQHGWGGSGLLTTLVVPKVKVTD
ncbi:Glycosyltransferase family 29 (sialyltransferase) [Musa troglodytarum]|uniref:Glycosyltransferase family 29 (Sialyltransferase) n=1 Tax=Musa troglodytarum TaxID=320322 RepID=A0A9E7HKK2_9LILI|nr:Glycosyltransferase family 29 (sialyltransferase) [Musa troglodytarum]